MTTTPDQNTVTVGGSSVHAVASPDHIHPSGSPAPDSGECVSDCATSLSISSDDDEASDDSDVDTEELQKQCHKILMEAAAGLPAHITRGSIPGISGRYGTSVLNVKLSRMTEWRRRKQDQEAAALRERRDVAYQQDPTKKALMTHFFRPLTPVDNSGKRPITSAESSVGDLTDEAGSEVEDFEVEDIIRRFPDEVAHKSSSPVPPKFYQPPTAEQAADVIPVLLNVMRSRRATGAGYKYTNLDRVTLTRFSDMLTLFRLYANDEQVKGKWQRASEIVANSRNKSTWYCRELRRWCREFVENPTALPESKYGAWSASVLHSDEDVKLEITEHLQSLEKFFSANDLLRFINAPAILQKLGRRKPFSLRTAQRWLRILGFRWRVEKKGMYSDGHEREDVVKYRQDVFLPQYLELNERAAQFDEEGKLIPRQFPIAPGTKEVMFHHHDESTFFANDRRKLRWIHSTESPKPYAKGDGQSVMVADFVSSAIGWLRSPDGAKRARVTLRPGKARDGYFTHEEFLTQLTTAMDILEDFYPEFQHVFILDNATTHTKRSETALSARRMPKNPSPTFTIKTVVRDQKGRPLLDQTGRVQTVARKMEDARFADGTPQPLYFPADHPKFPNYFKGMTQLLKERGFKEPEKLRAECKGFKCACNATECCQRRILFNQPDFANVLSMAENLCLSRGFIVLFLPKFHPEMNFIEMCWGYGKRLYRELPPASSSDRVEANALWSLDQVPLQVMRR